MSADPSRAGDPARQTPPAERPRFYPPAAPPPPPPPVHRPAVPHPDSDPPGHLGPPPPRIAFSEGFYRLHGASAVLRALTVILVFEVVAGWPIVEELGLSVAALVTLPVIIAAFGGGFLSWWQVRFRVVGDDLIYESGLARRRSRQVPLSRLQAVDIVRPLVARMLGLAEVRLELAGGDRGEICFRYLSRRLATELRTSLLAYAAGLSGRTPPAPERRVYRMSFPMLLGACLLRVPVLLSVILLIGLVVLGVESGEAGVLGGIVPILIGLVRAVFSPLLAYSNLTVAISPDGLRLRYGLVESRMQTLPPRRVQAVRVVEPMLWRVFGWARLEANVAGYVGDRQMATAVLLPAAPRRLAFGLVGWVFPGADLARLQLLPARGRLGGRAAGADEAVFVSRRGLACHTLEIVAHARAQSVQLTMAPWQWRRRVATVHVDTPPGPVRVQAPDRDVVEARVIVESIAERSRRSRAGADRPEYWAVQPPR